jgi:hypothetical protein
MGRCEFDDTGLAFTQMVKDCRFLAGVDWRSSQDLALRLARSSPDLTRSRIIARSNSAKTPIIWNSALPAGVEVSTPCC